MPDHYLLLFIGSFAATLTGSLLGIGGGFIVLGLLSVLFPVTVLVPVLAGVLVCIDFSRAIAFRSYLHTPIFYAFSSGGIIGVFIGAMIFISLPEKVIGTGLAALIVFSLILPADKIRWNIKYPFFWIGTVHSFLSTMFGYGGILQTAMIRTQLKGQQITACLAFCFLVLEIMKVCTYTIHGFDYWPYLGSIAATACGAIPASYIGKQLTYKVSSTLYRRGYKILICVIALHLLIKIWA